MELSLGPTMVGVWSAGGFNKRSHEMAFEKVKEEGCQSFTSNLVLRSGQEDDDKKGDKEKKNSCNIHKINGEEEENYVVGWPPIKAWRRKLLHQQYPVQQARRIHNNIVNAIYVNRLQSSSMAAAAATRTRIDRAMVINDSKYVKVKMEGAAVSRMIDLNLYGDYNSLTYALLNMFSQYEGELSSYLLTYQDKDGDWMLAGDVPWLNFMESAQRLEIKTKI